MTPEQLRADLARRLAGRQLLDHPFYRRWQAGKLARVELGAYAAQYRHFEAALPGILVRVRDALPEGPARKLVERNLADETGNPAPHVDLLIAFAEAVEAPSHAEATPATRGLLELYEDLSASSGAEGLAGLLAYESQAPGIAASKADGLRRHYGLDSDGTAFWELHATMDVDHTRWAIEALAEMPVAPETVLDAAARAGDAWWAFLDEREAEAATTPARG